MTDVRDVNLNRLAIFVAVVETGSMTAAAARLGMAKTMVSTHMQRLEAEVGASLLLRTTRRLTVSEAGRAFYDASCAILAATEQALAALGGDGAAISGTLRVSAPNDYGELVAAPALVALRRKHPALAVELLLSERYVDLVAERIDVALRLGRLGDSSYRAVRLGGFVKWLVASPDFVAEWGVPAAPADLAALPYAAMSLLPQPLLLDLRDAAGTLRTVRCRNGLQANTASACRIHVLAGGGFGLLTDFAIRADVAAGRLVRLLPEWSGVPAGIHAVFPPASQLSAKARAFVDELQAQLQAQLPAQLQA